MLWLLSEQMWEGQRVSDRVSECSEGHVLLTSLCLTESKNS